MTSMRCANCAACSTPRDAAIRTRCFPARSAALTSRPASRPPHELPPHEPLDSRKGFQPVSWGFQPQFPSRAGCPRRQAGSPSHYVAWRSRLDMKLCPSSAEELARSLRDASQAASRIERIDLSALSRILEHAPEDMTVTVEAGATLASLQRALASRGQWLPVDPPHPERLTLAGLLDTNASGPRRAGFGTIRDYVIGLRVALADGRLIRSGGKVVKNVAGYDLMKLFIGARGTLGVIVEVTFKLLPLPEAEA